MHLTSNHDISTGLLVFLTDMPTWGNLPYHLSGSRRAAVAGSRLGLRPLQPQHRGSQAATREEEKIQTGTFCLCSLSPLPQGRVGRGGGCWAKDSAWALGYPQMLMYVSPVTCDVLSTDKSSRRQAHALCVSGLGGHTSEPSRRHCAEQGRA